MKSQWYRAPSTRALLLHGVHGFVHMLHAPIHIVSGLYRSRLSRPRRLVSGRGRRPGSDVAAQRRISGFPTTAGVFQSRLPRLFHGAYDPARNN